MKVLLIHRYFWPDSPPYASMLRDIAEVLAADGHEVTVLTSQPSYGKTSTENRQPWRETRNGVTIRRVWLFPEEKQAFFARGVNLLLFVFRIFFHILADRKYQVIMAATTPPVVVASGASIAAKWIGAKFVYHCQDIHPEILVASGLIKRKWLVKTLRYMDFQTTRRAWRVVTLSRDMKNALLARGELEAGKIVVINNFVSEVRVQPEAVSDSSHEVRFQILFAGNLGYFQGLDAIIEAASKESFPEVQLVFLGDGAAKDHLQRKASQSKNRNIVFHGRVSSKVADEYIANCDLSLVSLAAGVIHAAYPSKTLTCLAQGKPILAVVEKESELAQMIKAEGVGFLASPGDPESFEHAVCEALKNRVQVPAMGRRARELAQRSFSRERKMPTWRSLFREIGNEVYGNA